MRLTQQMRAVAVAVVICALAGCQSAKRPAAAEAPHPPSADVVSHSPQPAYVAAIKEPLNDPARLCPADARIYLRVDNMAEWRQRGDDDPLAKHLVQLIESIQPPAVWQMERLGLDKNQMFDTYFGHTVAVVVQKIDKQLAPVLMTRVDRAELGKLPHAMGLEPWDGAENLGPFLTYRLEALGREFVFALGRRWLLVTEMRRVDHLRRLITAVARHRTGDGASSDTTVGAQALADAITFHAMLAKLPRTRAVTMVTRNSDNTERHAVAVVTDGQDLTAHYVAIVPRIMDFQQQAESAAPVDFGLLPASTISAASINVSKRSPYDLGLLDVLLFPHSLQADVLPRLSPPSLAFLGQVPAEQVHPNPGVAVPVVGIALRLKDPSVSGHLDRIIRGLHLLTSLGELDVVNTLLGLRAAEFEGTRFHVADFGRALARRIQDPQLAQLIRLPSTAGLKLLSFGRIGEWYVICSQEAFFRECIEAQRDPTRRFTHTPVFAALPFEAKPRLVVSAMTRVKRLSTLLEEVAVYWQQVHSQEMVPLSVDDEETSLEQWTYQIEHPLRWLADSVATGNSFAMQVWREGETELRGKLTVVRLVDELDSVD